MKAYTKNHDVYLILCLLSAFAVPVYYYGLRPLVMGAIGVLCAIVLEWICLRLFGLKRQKGDYSCVVTALLVTLVMPATVDYLLVIIGVCVGLLLAKYPFGGTDHQIFSSAALGLAVLSISFPTQMSTFPAPHNLLPLSASLAEETGIIYATTPAAMLKVDNVPQLDVLDVLLGRYAGPMGATCILVLGAVLLFLWTQHIISMWVIGAGVSTAMIYSLLFTHISSRQIENMGFTVISGIFLFGFIFMASDRRSVPRHRLAQVLYGILLSLCVMLFRAVRTMDIEFVYVLLFLAPLKAPLDQWAGRFTAWLGGKLSALPWTKKDTQKEGASLC